MIDPEFEEEVSALRRQAFQDEMSEQRSRRVMASVSVLGFLCFAGLNACTSKRRDHGPEVSEGPLVRDEALTDLDKGAKGATRRTIPKQPEKWQKTQDCDPDAAERMVNGACYLETAKKPPCGPKLLEHEGACFRAIAKAPSPPTSIER